VSIKQRLRTFWQNWKAEGNPQETEVDWNEIRLRQQIAHNRELSGKLARLHRSIRALLCDLVAIDPRGNHAEEQLRLVQAEAHMILKEGARHG
jgi:hypothetical protein